MSSSQDSDKRVYLIKSVVLTIAGVIFSGGVCRVGRTLGNRLLGGGGVDSVWLGVISYGGDTCGSDLGKGLLKAFLARFYSSASVSSIS